MDQKPSDVSKLDMPFYGAFGSTIISFVLTLAAYCSPYWLESYPFIETDFIRAGIWSLCFDNYINLEDQKGNIWHGCYWMFNQDIIQKGMWEYFSPHWLIAIQVLITVVFILQCICMICMILYFLLYGIPAAESMVTFICHIISVFIMLAVVVTYGIGFQDRRWMPRPDHMHLSWSYGFACLSMLASIVAACFLYCVSMSDKALQEEFEYFDQYADPNMPLAGSQYGRSQPASYMGTRSNVQSQRPAASLGGFQEGSSKA